MKIVIGVDIGVTTNNKVGVTVSKEVRVRVRVLNWVTSKPKISASLS